MSETKTGDLTPHPKMFDFHLDGTNNPVLTGKPITEPHTNEEVSTRDGKTNMNQVSIPGMQEGSYTGALANAFINVIEPGVSRAPTPDEFWDNYRLHTSVYEKAVEARPQDVALVASQKELLDAVEGGKIALVKSIEGLYIPLNSKGLDMLGDLAHDGVRNFGVMWNWENGIGTPHTAEKENKDKGLTGFGVDVVKRLAEIPGAIIDTSHSSAKTAEEILKYANPGQVIASHTASRELNPHTRNLPHDIAMAIGEKGMIGVAYYAPFVQDPTGERPVSPFDVVRHILDLKKRLGSTDHIGLGTDMGGMGKTSVIPGMEHVGVANNALYAAMKTSGEFTEAEIEGIFGQNALQYLVSALPEK